MAKKEKAYREHISKSMMYDTRLTRRFLDRGILEQVELDQHLKDLPDSTDNVDWIDVENMMDDLLHRR